MTPEQLLGVLAMLGELRFDLEAERLKVAALTARLAELEPAPAAPSEPDPADRA